MSSPHYQQHQQAYRNDFHGRRFKNIILQGVSQFVTSSRFSLIWSTIVAWFGDDGVGDFGLGDAGRRRRGSGVARGWVELRAQDPGSTRHPAFLRLADQRR